MTGGLPLTVEHSVELLERALGYTRGRLAGVTPGNLRAPTPCAGWTVHDLLAHMDDAMDAFLEAADGRIALRPGGEVGSVAVVAVVAVVQAKACALLGAWSGSPGRGTDVITVGDRPVPRALLVGTAALEVAVHGWDVGWATGDPVLIPRELALALLPVADVVVTPADRGVRFAAPVRTRRDAPPGYGLLAQLGRSPEPIGQSSGIPRTGDSPAP